jgi:uncharacterized protein (UPF0335 family)
MKEPTISVNGGPEVPMSVAKAALEIVKKRRVAAPGRVDLEDITGRNPENEEKARNIVGERLRGIVERIERLEEERKALGSDIKDIYSEAKSAGFDVKVLRQLIRIRKAEPADVEEQETLLEVYRRAIGM